MLYLRALGAKLLRLSAIHVHVCRYTYVLNVCMYITNKYILTTYLSRVIRQLLCVTYLGL